MANGAEARRPQCKKAGDIRQFVFRMSRSQPPRNEAMVTVSRDIGHHDLGDALDVTRSCRPDRRHAERARSRALADGMTRSGRKPVPSTTFGVVAIIGEMLGVAGLTLGQLRGERFAALRTGTIACLFQMYLFFGQFIFLSILHTISCAVSCPTGCGIRERPV